MPSSLVVDFYGPIAFRFCKKVAIAYIPPCDYHYCNVLTDSDDVSPDIDKAKTFTISGPTSTSGKTEVGPGRPLISLDWGLCGIPPKPSDCYCIFELPLPDFIHGLRAEYVKIVAKGRPTLEGKYARGVRFYYSDSQKPTVTPAEPTKLGTIDPTNYHPNKSSGLEYRIEIRYHDINPIEPRQHADADLCSASMRKLFPPLDTWTVDFNDPNERKAPVAIEYAGPHGVDCTANGLVFDDGGLSFSEDRREK
jgi:hypothetical protein